MLGLRIRQLAIVFGAGALFCWSSAVMAAPYQDYRAADNESETSSETGRVVIERRRATEYGKAAYSFRYKTHDKNVHKNHVDLVYSADGKLRFNNHGGLQSQIANLGKRDGLTASKAELKKAKWTPRSVAPVEGDTYSLNIDEYGVKMNVIFKLVKVTPEKIELDWEPKKANWSVSIDRRGAAGTSGMNAARTETGSNRKR